MPKFLTQTEKQGSIDLAKEYNKLSDVEDGAKRLPIAVAMFPNISGEDRDVMDKAALAVCRLLRKHDMRPRNRKESVVTMSVHTPRAG